MFLQELKHISIKKNNKFRNRHLSILEISMAENIAKYVQEY